jgi:hypothetical protein
MPTTKMIAIILDTANSDHLLITGTKMMNATAIAAEAISDHERPLIIFLWSMSDQSEI